MFQETQSRLSPMDAAEAVDMRSREEMPNEVRKEVENQDPHGAIKDSATAVISMFACSVVTDSYGSFQFQFIAAHAASIPMSIGKTVLPNDAMAYTIKQALTQAVASVYFQNYAALDEIESDIAPDAALEDIKDEFRDNIDKGLCTIAQVKVLSFSDDKSKMSDEFFDKLRISISGAVAERMRKAPALDAADHTLDDTPVMPAVEQPQGIPDESVYATFRASDESDANPQAGN